MFFSKSKGKRPPRQPDKLALSDINPAEIWLLGNSGVPSTADSCAYEPVQRLLAVGTLDGRIKLMGKDGVEKTLFSAAKRPYPTKQLQFLFNRGVLVRIAEGGFLEAWNFASTSKAAEVVTQLASIKVAGDKICCADPMLHDPYIILGCSSGCIRFAALTSAGGVPVAVGGARQVQAIKLLPYRGMLAAIDCTTLAIMLAELMGSRAPVTPEQLDNVGEVTKVSVQSLSFIHQVLVVYASSGLAVWDLRAQQLLASLKPKQKGIMTALQKAGTILTACWVGTEACRGDFATGHESGCILVWSLPGLDAPARVGPLVVTSLRVVAGAAEPVRGLRFVRGVHDALLVLGGQQQEEPDALSLITLPQVCAEGEESMETITKLPWFGNLLGYAVVAAPGTISGQDDPVGVIQLVEGGQLIMHDLAQHQATPLALPFQDAANITCTTMCVLPVSRPADAPSYALHLSALRSVAGALNRSSTVTAAGIALNGGVAPRPAANEPFGAVYCTGYKGGYVRMWDVCSEQPRLLAVAPSPAATKLEGPSLRGVSALEVVWEHGMLFSGHSKGEVRLYQFSTKPRQAECVEFESIGINASNNVISLGEEPAGFQLKLRSCVHGAEITALHYCPHAKSVVVGDKLGGLSLIDVSKPAVVWYMMHGHQPIASVQLALVKLPAKRERAASEYEGLPDGAVARAVFVATIDASLGVLGVATGTFLGKNGELKPKNASRVLYMELLDAHGNPVWMSHHSFHQASLSSRSAPERAAGVLSSSELDSSPERQRGRQSAAHGTGNDDNEESPASDMADDPEDEDLDADAYLASAAAQVEQAKRDRRRGKVAHVLTLGVVGSRKDKPSKESSMRRTHSSDAFDSAAHAADVLSSGTADDDGAGPSTSGQSAASVLLVSDLYIRIYSAHGVIIADRATDIKVQNSAPLIYANTFHVNGSPGLVALAENDDAGLVLQVYTLPGLELLHEVAVHECTRWCWEPPQASSYKLSKLVATSCLGQMVLLGQNNELLQLAIAAGIPQLLDSPSMYDWELAAAANAAITAHEQALLAAQASSASAASTAGRAFHPASGRREGEDGRAQGVSQQLQSMDLEDDDHDEGPEQFEHLGRREDRDFLPVLAKVNKNLGGVFSKVQQGVSRAFQDTTKSLQTVARGLESGVKEMGRLFVEDEDSVYQRYHAEMPDLASVLSQEGLDEGHTSRGKPSRRASAAQAGGDSDSDGIPVSSPLKASPIRPKRPAAAPASATTSVRADTERAQPAAASAGMMSAAVDTARAGAGTGACASSSSSSRARAAYGASTQQQYSAEVPNRLRTASEIRKVYRRSTGSTNTSSEQAAATDRRTRQVQQVAEEARSKLQERGEKLRQLDEKAGDLEESAAGFAELAKQLANQQRKRWW